jgi:hypothetical protein
MRGYELENLPSYPDPEMYQYAFDLTQKSNEKTVPISVERFEGHGPYQLQATSFAILLPGTNAYLSQGDLPKFGIGTRIIQTNLKTEPKAKK